MMLDLFTTRENIRQGRTYVIWISCMHFGEANYSEWSFSVLIINWNYLITGMFSGNFITFCLHNVVTNGKANTYFWYHYIYWSNEVKTCLKSTANCGKRAIDRSLNAQGIEKSAKALGHTFWCKLFQILAMTLTRRRLQILPWICQKIFRWQLI